MFFTTLRHRSIKLMHFVQQPIIFETIPWSSKLSTIVGLDCYFSRLDAIVLEMSEQSIDENSGTGTANTFIICGCLFG